MMMMMMMMNGSPKENQTAMSDEKEIEGSCRGKSERVLPAFIMQDEISGERERNVGFVVRKTNLVIQMSSYIEDSKG